MSLTLRMPNPLRPFLWLLILYSGTFALAQVLSKYNEASDLKIDLKSRLIEFGDHEAGNAKVRFKRDVEESSMGLKNVSYEMTTKLLWDEEFHQHNIHEEIMTTMESKDIEQDVIEASDFVTYKAALVLSRFGRPVVVVFGVLGNTLSFLVMIQPQNRRISCCVYMAALAVSDTTLLFMLGYLWLPGQVPDIVLTDLQCGITVYIAQAAIYAGMVFILCMTADRFVAVKFPLKSATWCSKKRAKVTIAVTFCAVLVYSVPYLIYTKVILDGVQCVTFRQPTYALKIFTTVNMFLTSMTPFAILMVLNIFIIKTIRNRGKFFSDNMREISEEEKARERQLTTMLLLASFAFLILTLPQYVRYFYLSLTGFPNTPKGEADSSLALQATNIVLSSNNAINFYLYCVGGSKFRQDLYKLFQCCPHKRKCSHDAPTPSVITTITEVPNA